MEILRTPDKYFNDLPDYPFKPNYLELDLGLRMHYIDEGRGEIILCLHGEPTWSYLYRKFYPVLSNQYRVIAPDLIGFGKSDKLPATNDYDYSFHFNVLINFIEKLNLKDITLVVHDWGGLLGLGILGAHPDWFNRVVILNTALPIGNPLPFAFKLWRAFAKYHPNLPVGSIVKKGSYKKDQFTKEIKKAYNAPFPSKKYKAAAKAFPLMVPGSPQDLGVKEMKKAREVLSNWNKPCLVMFSDKDPIMSGLDKFFRKIIPSANDQPQITIKNASHFLQEDSGEEIAENIRLFMIDQLKNES